MCDCELNGKGEGRKPGNDLANKSKAQKETGSGKETASVILSSLGAGLTTAGGLLGPKSGSQGIPLPDEGGAGLTLSNPLVLGGIALGGVGLALLLTR